MAKIYVSSTYKPSPGTPRIFVSYARSDGETFAKELRRRLTECGFSLWQDRADLEGGKDWWQQIVEALSHVEYMVLVMTPAAMHSDVVRKEWRLARQKGVGVIPVIAAPDLDFRSLPRWMRDTHFVSPDDPEQWKRFIHTLESPPQTPRVPFMVEDLPGDFIPRPGEFDQLIAQLLDGQRGEAVAITAALRGAGGYGKTTLAKALCHDERVQEAFHDGILWVTLGENPGDLIGHVLDLIETLSGERPGFTTLHAAETRLAELLGERDMLIVIDDVWNGAHLKPFLHGGARCARLITTRNSDTLPPDSKQVVVDAMRQDEAVALLGAGLPPGDRQPLHTLAARLGEWPLLLKLVNGVLRDRVLNARQPLPAALASVNKALEKRGLTAFDARDVKERHQAVERTLSVSLERLDETEQARYRELAIFPEDVDIPLSVVEKLWSASGGLDELDTEELCLRLNRLSLLLACDLTGRHIRLHDVLRTYLQNTLGEKLPAVHSQLLDAYALKTWADLPPQEPYAWNYLAYHLAAAGRKAELRTLLFDFNWLKARLAISDVNALIADFQFLQNDAELLLVQETLRLAAHILSRDRTQLAGQLVGRLLASKAPAVQALLEQAKQRTVTPWLRHLADRCCVRWRGIAAGSMRWRCSMDGGWSRPPTTGR